MDQHWVAPMVRVEIQITVIADSLVTLSSCKPVPHLVASGRVDITVEDGACRCSELLLPLLSHLNRFLKQLLAPLQGPVITDLIVIL